MNTNLYVIYCISNSPYQEWQADLLDYSFEKVKQPGILIRICSEDSAYPGRKLPLSRIGHTVGTPNFSRLSSKVDWPVMNKPGSLNYFFENSLFHDDDTLIFLDPDMIFIKAWNPEVKRGGVYGQMWKMYSQEYCQKTSIEPELCPVREEDCIMYPFAIKAADMKSICKNVENYSRKGYLKTHSWMADMPAFQTAMEKHKLIMYPEENIGLCNNWDNNNDAGAPIMHYCQPIVDKNGEKIWQKRKYKPWRIPPDSSLATNRVDREVLKTLREYIVSRNPQTIPIKKDDFIYRFAKSFQS